MVLKGGAGFRRMLGRPATKTAVLLLCALPALSLLLRGFLGIGGGLGANPAEALIRGLGDWTLRLLCATLAVTPLRQALGWTFLASWRRGLGLWTFAYATLHLLAYAWFDMGWDMADIVHDVGQRPFIAVGMLALGVLSLLALTSLHAAMRWLGGARWKALHRGVYAVAGLALLHFYWLRAGKHNFAEVNVYTAVLAVLLLWRVLRLFRA